MMNELQIKSPTLDSREVAEMVGKDHSKLLRDIRGYIDNLNQSKIGHVDFFTDSTYGDLKGELRPRYNVSKKGCEFIAHKLTGIKGTEFTARYINRFHEMENTIETGMYQKPMCMEDILIAQLQEMKNMRLEVTETKEQVQAIRDVIIINPKAEWRKETNNILTAIGKVIGDYSKPRHEVYEALKARANCRPTVLINNLKKRALDNGMAPSKADKLNILDVLENDPRLREIYITIVKEMAIKNNVA